MEKILLLGKIFLHKNGEKCCLSDRIFLHKMEENLVKMEKLRYMKHEKNPVYFLQKMQVLGDQIALSLMFQRIT